MKAMYHTTRNIVRTNNKESKEFEIKEGLKQECVLRPLLFSVGEAMKRAKMRMKPLIMGYWKLEGVRLTELLFTDDMVIIADSERNLQESLECLNRELKKINMRINVNKTKSMIISARDKDTMFL